MNLLVNYKGIIYFIEVTEKKRNVPFSGKLGQLPRHIIIEYLCLYGSTQNH